MTSTQSRQHSPKLCPRCGAFYQDLSSKTCPQCFAKLELLTDEEAAGLIEEQEQRSRDPEYVRNKEADDEAFRQQSFGACFGVGLALIAMVVLSTAFIVIALHRHPAPQPAVLSLPPGFNAVVPAMLSHEKRASADADVTLPDSAIRVYHGVYDGGEQVYAVPSSGVSDTQLAALRMGVSLVARQQTPSDVEQEIERRAWRYFVIGHSAGSVQTMVQALPQ